MKLLINITRVIVGVLFIFSGLVKANDPMGLAYKMEEFFEAWHFPVLPYYISIILSFGMNVLEIAAGIALLIGWQLKFTTRFLLALIIFFTFLTSYVLFSGKITNCGCFGDCIPLTPIQTFIKDIALLAMIALLVGKYETMQPLLHKALGLTTVILAIIISFGLQWYVFRHLPIVDCLPYKKGNNILQQMKVPADAVPDSFDIVYQYKKNNQLVEFDANHFPNDFDSTYEYINRVTKLIRKGNATPKIVDFALQTLKGTDTTAALFAEAKPYILLFSKEIPFDRTRFNFEVFRAIRKKRIPLFLITADGNAVNKILNSFFTILKCDITVIKTAARVNPTYFFMKGDTIVDKISYADKEQLLKTISSTKNY